MYLRKDKTSYNLEYGEYIEGNAMVGWNEELSE